MNMLIWYSIKLVWFSAFNVFSHLMTFRLPALPPAPAPAKLSFSFLCFNALTLLQSSLRWRLCSPRLLATFWTGTGCELLHSLLSFWFVYFFPISSLWSWALRQNWDFQIWKSMYKYAIKCWFSTQLVLLNLWF